MADKFDDLLTQIGTGKWNYFFFSIILYYCFFLPGQVLSIVFAVPSMTYTCKIPEEDKHRAPEQNLIDACGYMVNSSVTGELEEKICTDFEFDDSTYTTTLTSEHNLVCGRNFLRATYHGIFMFGNVFGPAIAGIISDRYGRKIVAVTGGMIFAITALVLSFIHNFSVILALRFLMGFFNLPTAYILALEICEPKIRSYAGICLALPWALGTMAFGGIAYFVRNWHWLQFIMAVPLIILTPAIWIVDESPRFLIIRGYHHRALKILKKAARWNNNGKLPPDSEIKRIMAEIQEESDKTSTKNTDTNNALMESQNIMRSENTTACDKWFRRFKFGLCSTAHIRSLTLIMTLSFFVNSLVYHGLMLSAKDFSINVYAYVVIAGLTEIPAYSIPAFVVEKFGRRLPTSFCFLGGGASLLILILIPGEISWLVLVLAMLGKLGISSSGQIIHLFLSELYPTEYRLQGLGTAILAQRLGSIMAPLIVFIFSPLSWWAPSVVMGALSLLTGIITLKLPETLGATLPDTLADLEELFDKKKDKKIRISEGTHSERSPMQDCKQSSAQ